MAKTGGFRNPERIGIGIAATAGLAACAGILNTRKAHQMWSSIKRVSWKDEHLIGGMVYEEVIIDPPEFSDPAILAVRDGPKYRYSKDELMGLKEVPLSKKKPDFINAECVPPSIWDPERWGDAKKSATPTDAPAGGGKGDVSLQPDGRRGRPGDPRERLRKENDGIVLSPQRRSFNTGCFVPVREQPNHNGRPRAHSPIGGAGGAKGDNAHIGPREVPSNSGARRIGSGRILRDSWDFNDKNDGGDNDYYRNQDDRRPFRRDFDMSRDKDKQQRNNMGRYGNRRISGGEKDEEPEWFSGGPMSQNDTIELRGFDESDRGGICGGGNKKKLNSSQAKRVREWAKKKGGVSDEKPDEEQQQQHAENGQKPQNQQVDTKGGCESETKNAQDGAGTINGSRNDNIEKNQDQDQQNDNDKENRQGHNPASSTGGMEIINENSFIFDDIFKCDTFPGLLSNGVEGTADNNTKSKFSRWFKRESPDKTAASLESRRSSAQEEHLLKNLLNDLNEPTGGNVAVNIPQLGSSESYFAPISPAAVNAVAGEPGNPKPGQVNIADMFQRGKQAFGGPKAAQQQNDVLNNIKTQFPGKVLSLNELESNIRKGLDISANQNHQNQQNKHMIKKDDEMAAFKRLLAQVSGGQVVPANGSNHQKMPAMSLMEMLSHSQQQDEAQARLNSQKPHLMGGPASPKTPSMNPLHSEFLLKMQQAQQEQQAHLQRHQQQQQQQANMLNKLMGLHAAGPHLRSSPLQELAQQQSKELLSRPEAQAILQGMKRGDITPQHIYQQLANPALQARHREMLSAILRIQRLGPSPRVLSPAPPHMFPQQQQQQQLRVSPLPNAYCVSPIMANSPNTLTVPAMHQRIPSPRELQVHTQTILQRALIKKRLEEQQVNFRKKQEMQQMPNHASSNKNVPSPTPLAFTPTSVLRKMTADKEDGNKEAKNVEANKFQQGRAVIGARMPQQQQNNQWNSQYHSKQPGRPIVKANVGYQNAGAEQFFNAQQQQFMFNQQQSRQQQQAVAGQQVGGQFGQHQKSSQSNAGVSSLGYIGQYSNQSNQQPQQFPQLTQQQLRAQHQQSLPVSTSSAQPAQPQQNSQSFSQQQQQQQNTAWQQFLSAAAAQQSGRSNNARKEDDSSSAAGNVASSSNTTANQLSRWFSSDLLERARVGELPSTAGLAEHVVSLEEIERQSAPPVHN